MSRRSRNALEECELSDLWVLAKTLTVAAKGAREMGQPGAGDVYEALAPLAWERVRGVPMEKAPGKTEELSLHDGKIEVPPGAVVQ